MNTNNGWLDIASAPKDGTEILAWRHDCGQFIASYTSADSFPMTQDELDAYDEETLFAKDWFTQWPQALRLEGSEAPTLWQPMPADPCLTCGGHGLIGGLTPHSGYDAEPCPECTPPASAQDDAKDEQARGQVDVLEVARETGLRSYLHGVNAMEARMLLQRFVDALSAAAPAAGDARAWQGLTDAERDGYVGELVDYGTEFVSPLYSVVESIEKRLREKNAAAQQGGE
ncbi:MAG: hypothetical protein QHC88_16695 [Achromobacter sp.]|uniref:hypothetical protein n=1 Tax=Achromobacter sp. TaxID=134375 RepID=UPI0029AC9286|nr:hypothetical protein [Achromobacter sp.]MDX3986888.1 hypothetical protein [Achromobacter sp.]